MNTIFLIIQREYLTRVTKKSFLIMTIIGPLLMSALFFVPAWIASVGSDDSKTIAVIDKSGKYENSFTNNTGYTFIKKPDSTPEVEKLTIVDNNIDAVLLIKEINNQPDITLFSDKHTGVFLKSYLTSIIKDIAQKNKLNSMGITPEQIAKSEVDIQINTVKWTEQGEKVDSDELMIVAGFISAFIIYMFIFMYGAQVMRGVIEEKTSRVVEVIISSVRPFQLMAGKIIGIAMVALTQFVLWGLLTTLLVFSVKSAIGLDFNNMQNQGFAGKLPPGIFDAILNYNWGMLLFGFLFFFLCGYLLYASLFAAIGSAVDNETDTQQFMLPVTIPLILAFVAAQTIIEFPSGSVAFWFSMVPFTSPIIMPIRIATEAYQTWELLLSMSILLLSILVSIWFAAKIYRVGILMYGKKISYKELWKWIKYK